MSRFGRARLGEVLAAQDAGEAARLRKVIDRTAAMLKMYRQAGERFVAIEEVLDLLGADPDTAPPVPQRDPRADPVTGCLPVTAPPP